MCEEREREKAYLAGLVDGEGSIVIYRDKRYETFGIKLEIANTDFELLEWVKTRFGGGIVRAPHKNTRLGKTLASGPCPVERRSNC